MKTVLILTTAMLAGLASAVTNGEHAPVISNLNVTPAAGPTRATYTITVKITDPQGPDDVVPMLHQVRENRETIDVPIRDDGTHGDESSGDGVYTGTNSVPDTAATGTHLFRVFVKDHAGNRSNVLEYRFTVLDQMEL